MAPNPIATGNFDKTPFAHLLVYMEQRAMSGTLAVWPEADGVRGQDRVLVFKGQLVGARLLQPAASLEQGLLGLFSRRTAPYAFYEGNLLGDESERLIGRVDPFALIASWLRTDEARDDLVAAMLGRVGEAALALSPKADLSRFDFTDQEYAFAQRIAGGPASINTLATGGELDQLRALRVLYLLLICKMIAPMPAAPRPAAMPPPAPMPPPPPAAGAAPRQAQDPPPAGAQFEVAIDADDAGLSEISVPAAPAFHPHVLPDSVAPSARGGAAGGGSPGEPDRLNSIPPPPPGLSDEHHKRWLQIVATGKLIDNQNYFEMLGVPKTAKASEVRTEFVRVAKDWHPDRLPSELSMLKPFVQTIFGYMSEAHACLSDEKQRLPYLQSVREGGGTPATDRLMQRILDSAMQYERVLVYTRKHDYVAALELLQKILVVTADEPDYHAMYAWLMMQSNPSNRTDVTPPYKDMLAAVDTALKLHPEHEKANLYKAQIMRRMGKHKDALEWFRKVVRINPNNLEAAREVRIAQMRGESMRPSSSKRKDPISSGLFGKLFKKK